MQMETRLFICTICLLSAAFQETLKQIKTNCTRGFQHLILVCCVKQYVTVEPRNEYKTGN